LDRIQDGGESLWGGRHGPSHQDFRCESLLWPWHIAAPSRKSLVCSLAFSNWATWFCASCSFALTLTSCELSSRLGAFRCVDPVKRG
jgi:hypothetical protein